MADMIVRVAMTEDDLEGLIQDIDDLASEGTVDLKGYVDDAPVTVRLTLIDDGESEGD